MKKLTHIIFALAILTGIQACYKDKGNYVYTPLQEITIKGIGDHYSRISGEETLVIEPEVSSNMANADLEYTWQLYETNATGRIPELITIGKEKNLNYPVNNYATAWTLVFRVKDKNTGVEKQASTGLDVITPFTRGWYVLKEENGKTDLDQFETPASIVPAELKENVYSLINGRKIEGHPQYIHYNNSYKSDLTGVIAETKGFFLLTDKELAVTDLNTLKQFRDLNSLFFAQPAVKAPGLITNCAYGMYLVNNGNLHTLTTTSANYGIFGPRLMADAANKPYQLSKYYISPGWGPFPVFFDEQNSTFLTSNTYSTTVDNYSDMDDTELPANNNNQRLLYMGQSMSYPGEGYAVLQDKTDPSKKSIAHIVPSTSDFEIGIYTQPIAAGDKINSATRYALITDAENLIYFATSSNEIWSRGLSNGHEQLQYTVPAGETVTFIKHRYYDPYQGNAGEQPYKYDYFMIGTTINGKYKVRMFKKSAGNLASAPDMVLEGNGSVADVLFVSPSMYSESDMIFSY